MNNTSRIATPPVKPVMVYDGDCRFCCLWIKKWQRWTGNQIEYLPYQSQEITAHFPEIPRGQFEKAVHFIETNGCVCSGAEAVFKSLSINPRSRFLSRWYQQSPAFADMTEALYRFVAEHRPFFSWLTRIFLNDADDERSKTNQDGVGN